MEHPWPWVTMLSGFHLEGGAGGKLPPQTAQLPPQKKKRRKEKRGRERERKREREREREREMGESIYLGIIIHVSNISLIMTNIKLMYKNTLCTHGGQLYVKVPHPLLPQIKFSG